MHETILVIDDDAEFVQFLNLRLEEFGYHVTTAPDGSVGVSMAAEMRPDLITLDIMMSGMDGWDTCRKLRSLSNVPILVITASGSVQDVVRGLGLGADDYLNKPFEDSELFARVQALLRRARAPRTHTKIGVYQVRNLELDTNQRILKVCDRQVDLTTTEFKLLALLMCNAGSVLRHRRCLTEVWGPEYSDSVDYLKLYVRYLRQKIEKDPSNPEYILTQWGVGYRMVDR